jgi:hypothetical protein
MLRRVRELADAIRDHLAKAGLLSEPLPRETGDRVPAHFYRPWFPANVNLFGGDGTWGLSQAQGLLELGSSLCDPFFPSIVVSAASVSDRENSIAYKKAPNRAVMDDSGSSGVLGVSMARCFDELNKRKRGMRWLQDSRTLGTPRRDSSSLFA